MGTIKKFEELKMWQIAREVNKEFHFLVIEHREFSRNFSLVDQMRRSCGSIMDNIAEGFDRGGNKEFLHFLSIAKASASEFRSQLYRALDFNYLELERFNSLNDKITQIVKMIIKMMIYLKKSPMKGNKFNN